MNELGITILDQGTVASPLGFQAAGVSCGLKKSGNEDFALIVSDRDCAAAGTFTSNLFPAAPVVYDRMLIENGADVRIVAVNSGVANACTGTEGLDRARATAAIAAEALGVASEQVLVCSTGRIGVQLPMDKIRDGIRKAVPLLSKEGGHAAAKAIMTTDTQIKETAVSFVVNGRTVTLGGMTKGAGMIAPHMTPAGLHATMLCFLTTDAEIAASDLAGFLAEAVSTSFNRISVDNDMSTNDTCLLLANGASGVAIRRDDGEAAELFRKALREVARDLAKRMVMDGEGASKFVEICVVGAATDAEAEACAKAIADSMLCKTAWFGADPNWGRVLAAAGYSGAAFQPENVSMDYDEQPVVRKGMDAGTPEAVLSELMKKREFTIRLDLGAGGCSCVRWTSDLTYDYVKINADYHT